MGLNHISAADLAAALREVLEEAIPSHRRELDWDRKWRELEDFAEREDED